MLPHISMNPMLALALLFAVGYAGALAVRRLKLPSVTGNIVVGVVVGPSVLGLLSRETADLLQPVAIFAMGLVTAVIGGHLSYRRLHNAKLRVFAVTAAQIVVSGVAVVWAVYRFSGRWDTAILLAVLGLGTASATVLSVFREERAKGILVKTTLASIALDNMACVVLFAAATAWVAHLTRFPEATGVPWAALGVAARELGASALLGAAMGWGVLRMARRRMVSEFTGLTFGVLAATGAAMALDLSPLTTNLAVGMVLGNTGREGEGVVRGLESLEPFVLTCFFTLAGAELDVAAIPAMGAAGVAYFVARAAGKTAGGFLGGLAGRAPRRLRPYLGAALIPQGGITVGLVVLLQGHPDLSPEFVRDITAIVLATVVLNEIVGPPIVRRAAHAVGEAGRGRRRLVEFLQEEHIRCPLAATDRTGVIRELGEFLIRTHGVREITAEELCETVEAREKLFSTAIGGGVALPHGRVESGREIVGVMGVAPEGIDFAAPDGQPVRVIILIATPEGFEDRHLEVLAAVAALMRDESVRARLPQARNSAEAYEIIEQGSALGYNHFLEE